MVILLLSSLFQPGPQASEEWDGPDIFLSFDEPIDIDGDTELTSLALSQEWRGAGSGADPYIIEDLNIDAEGKACGLSIRNTGLYMILRNLTIINATTGIFVQSSCNITIKFNHITRCQIGIRLDRSNDILISNCSLTNMSIHGIYEYMVENLNIQRCTFENCSNGTLIYKGNLIGIDSCTFIDNDRCGVFVEYEAYRVYLLNSLFRCNNIGFRQDWDWSWPISINSNLFIENHNEAVIAQELSRIRYNTFIENNNGTGDLGSGRKQLKLTGGYSHMNYYSDLTGPDSDGDGFVDVNYMNDEKPLANSPHVPDVELRIENNGSSALLEWDLVSGFPSLDIGGYRLYRKDPYFPFYVKLAELGPGKNIFVDEGLEKNLTYYYHMVPYGSINGLVLDHRGETSNTVNMTVDGLAPIIWITGPHGTFFRGTFVTVTWFIKENMTSVVNVSVHLDGRMVYHGEDKGHILLKDLVDGHHQGTVRAFDMAGNSGSSDFSFIIDNVGPVIRIIEPTTGSWVGDRQPTILCNITDELGGVERVFWRADVLDPWSEPRYWKNGFSIYLPYVGWNTIEIKASDTAGNQNVKTFKLGLDIEPPPFIIQEPKNGAYLPTRTVKVQWEFTENITDMVGSEFSLDGGEYSRTDQINETTLSNLQEGEHRIRIRVHDKVGNQHFEGIRFIIDVTPPTMILSTNMVNGYLNSSELRISPQCQDELSRRIDYFVKLDSGEYEFYTYRYIKYSDSGAIPPPPPVPEILKDLPDGKHTVWIKAVDEAGNSNETMLEFTVDTTYPGVDYVYPTDHNQLISDQKLFVSFSDDIDPTTIEVFINGAPVRSFWAENILIIEPVQDLKWGRTYSIDIIARDAAGNQLIPYELVISFPDRAWITCFVTDMKGEALANCSIRVDNRNASRTDHMGHSYLEIGSGPHILTFHLEGFMDLNLEIDIESGKTLNLGTIALHNDEKEGETTEDEISPVEGISLLIMILAIIIVLLSASLLIHIKRRNRKLKTE